ncbi:MAG: SDR family NAD(P)-dependent oxidoreductase [Kiritimatiellae bacterium]|nr:SDR family NAD(P)-dependent oxidoreductase [Kiritimatiellia bacterium]
MSKNVLITGASSGIGEALAKECAKRGDTLFLCGRNNERLQAVADACRSLGGVVYAETIDVTKKDDVEAWVKKCDSIAQIELVFCNAGVSTGEEIEKNIRKTFDINVGGVVNVVLPTIEVFRKRANELSNPGLRHIIIISSIAGYGPLKSCPSYSATKSCVKTWGLALRGMLKREGIRVSVICPGFIRSRITDKNTCPMPFFMEADKAARIILRRVDKNVGLIAFPWPMRLATWILSILPYKCNEILNSILPKKVS